MVHLSRHADMLRPRALAATAFAAFALSGCAEPMRVAAFAKAPAETARGTKATGKVAYLMMRESEIHDVGFAHTGTLAQSGEGSLGDRLFRESPEGFVEACRYVARGRVCELVPLPDGSYLGGGAAWVVQKGAKATPRASGWVAPSIAVNAAAGLGRDAQAVNSLAPIFLGRAYHCRFGDAGPVCLDVPATGKDIGYSMLGVFSLKDGPVHREVLWVGIFGDVNAATGDRAAGSAGNRALGIKELHRCETTEDSPRVTCTLVNLKDMP